MPTDVFRAAVLLLGPVAASTAHAVVYMSPQEAAELILGAKELMRKEATLTDDEVATIKKASGEHVRSKQLTYFKNKAGDVVFIDQALGKHEFITYAVAIKAKDASITGIEITDYRETYGHEIRRPEWRKQFVGKTVTSPLKLDDDVKNISGATLSSAHITGGARRMLRTYEAIKTRV